MKEDLSGPQNFTWQSTVAADKRGVKDLLYCQVFPCTIIDIGDDGGTNKH